MFIEAATDGWYLSVADLETRVVTRLTASLGDGSGGPAVSAAGLIAVARSNAGEYEIVVFDAAGAAVGSLAESGRGLWRPAWSPDGSRLCYLSVSPNGEDAEVVVSAVDGSERRVIWKGRDVSDVAWSPDGSKIAVVDAMRVWSLQLSDGAVWPLTPSQVKVVEIDWR